jgi:hypothetical protein
LPAGCRGSSEKNQIEELTFVDPEDLRVVADVSDKLVGRPNVRRSDAHVVAVRDDMVLAVAAIDERLEDRTFCFAIRARRSRRMSSSLFPLNMLPVMTSIQP